MAWLPSSMSSAFADPEEVRGLMARRSPEPDPVVLSDDWPTGWLRVVTPTRSGAMERVTCPRVVGYVLTKLASEFLRYRRDRVGD